MKDYPDKHWHLLETYEQTCIYRLTACTQKFKMYKLNFNQTLEESYYKKKNTVSFNSSHPTGMQTLTALAVWFISL